MPSSFTLPSEHDILAYIRQHNETGVNKKDLTSHFRVKGQEARRELKNIMRTLADNGSVVVHAKKYFIPQQEPSVSLDAVTLNVISTTEDGELLCEPVNKNLSDDFPLILLEASSNAQIGDTITANLQLINEEEGEFLATHVKKKEEHEEAELMGILKLRPHGPSIFLPLAKSMDTQSFIIPALPKGSKAVDGSVIRVQVGAKKYGQPTEVSILEVVSEDVRGSEIAVALHNHDIPHVFPTEVLNQASDLTPILDKDLKGREDLRKVPLVTIDGEDAKDFDDAVFAEPWETDKIKGGHHIIVAIADVAHYVKELSPLDREAFNRGNSVYLPGHVIPMLPEELSNDLCSLRPKEDRPTMVAHLYIDATGKLRNYNFTRAVIHSHARLTYNEVQQALDGEELEKTAPLMDCTIRPLYNAYKALLKNRTKRGALDFDMPESTFIMGEKNEVLNIVHRERHDAHRLIEEMMILANVAAASELQKRGAPCMYRIHPEPSATKIENLQLALKDFGIKLDVSGHFSPARIQGAIDRIPEHEKENMGMVILRSQEQARYDAENIGHFGLALDRYAHFTSPIRRYSDLVVHRSLIRSLKLTGHEDILPQDKIMGKADHLCITERRAQKAEWDVKDRLITKFYSGKLEQPFVAKITTLTKFGMFVSIDNGIAEGLLPLRHLSDDHYIYNEKSNKIFGKRTKKVYKLGDEIPVILSEADLVTGRLTFAPEGMQGGNPKTERKTFKRHKKAPFKKK